MQNNIQNRKLVGALAALARLALPAYESAIPADPGVRHLLAALDRYAVGTATLAEVESVLAASYNERADADDGAAYAAYGAACAASVAMAADDAEALEDVAASVAATVAALGRRIETKTLKGTT